MSAFDPKRTCRRQSAWVAVSIRRKLTILPQWPKFTSRFGNQGVCDDGSAGQRYGGRLHLRRGTLPPQGPTVICALLPLHVVPVRDRIGFRRQCLNRGVASRTLKGKPTQTTVPSASGKGQFLWRCANCGVTVWTITLRPARAFISYGWERSTIPRRSA